MSKFRAAIAIGLLAASVFLLFDKLFTPLPIQITLESGQEVTTQTAAYFSLNEALLLIMSSFVIGSSAVYLFYNSGTEKLFSAAKKALPAEERYDAVLPLLKEDERRVFSEIRKSGGSMLQNAMVLNLGLSKVKVARIISRLERKGVVIKERYGLTNKVLLK